MNTMAARPVGQRPKNLNLFSIRMPINAVVSILHRVSGFLLFLVIPLVLLLLQKSLGSAEEYRQAVDILTHPLAKLVLTGLTWAFAHHFLAGLRHLAMDVHWGTELKKARRSSRGVLVGAVLMTAAAAMMIW